MVLPSTVNISVASVSEEGLQISKILDAPSRGIEEISTLIKRSSENSHNSTGEGSFM